MIDLFNDIAVFVSLFCCPLAMRIKEAHIC